MTVKSKSSVGSAEKMTVAAVAFLIGVSIIALNGYLLQVGLHVFGVSASYGHALALYVVGRALGGNRLIGVKSEK